MRRVGLLLFMMAALIVPANAQKILHKAEKVFNWGGKIGCNSLFSNINSLSINDVEMVGVQQRYKVGFQASLFGRVNIDKFYLEPSLTWQQSESYIHFDLPDTDNVLRNVYQVYSSNSLDCKYKTVEIPIMIGYNIVKEDDYAMSLSVGPSFRYNYKIDLSSSLSETLRVTKDENTPLGLGISIGAGASIGRLFLNFIYQFGINEVDSDIHKIVSGDQEWTLRLKKRTNVMNFSLGFML